MACQRNNQFYTNIITWHLVSTRVFGHISWIKLSWNRAWNIFSTSDTSLGIAKLKWNEYKFASASGSRSWKRFRHYWPLVKGNPRWPMVSPHKVSIIPSFYFTFVVILTSNWQTVELPVIELHETHVMSLKCCFKNWRSSYREISNTRILLLFLCIFAWCLISW